MNSSRHRRCARGFTLIEVLLVMVTMLIIAGASVPYYIDLTVDAQVAASLHTVGGVQRAVYERYTMSGSYPAKLDPEWFVPPLMPKNPFEPTRSTTRSRYIDGSGNAAKVHPSDKTTATYDIYWYNPKNGRFRMRVPRQQTDAKTLELYNRANGTKLTRFYDITSL